MASRWSYILSAVQEHNTGFRENNWASMPLKVGPVPFHMIFQLHFHYVIPIIWWPIYSDLSRRRLIFLFYCVVLLCVFTFWVPSRFPYKKLYSIRLYLQWFVGGFMSCLRYLYLFTYDTLCCVLFFFVLCTLCCHVLWNVHLLLPFRYSLTFILY